METHRHALLVRNSSSDLTFNVISISHGPQVELESCCALLPTALAYGSTWPSTCLSFCLLHVFLNFHSFSQLYPRDSNPIRKKLFNLKQYQPFRIIVRQIRSRPVILC
jgi:hypothetical protein